jgi:hypothetical protein
LQGDHHAGGTGPAGPPGPVQIGLVLGGRVGVDDEVDAVHMDAAGGDVGSDQHAHGPGGEGREVALARGLGEVPVQLGGAYVGGGQLAGELARAVLGTGEDQRSVTAPGEGGGDRRPVGRGHGQQVVDDRGRSFRRVHRMLGRVAEEPADENIDGVVEGRREEHPLALWRGRVQQPADGGQEAEVGHVVGLVHHADLDVAEMAVTLIDQVGETAGAGDDDVHPVMQRPHLRPLRRSAENRGGAQAGRPGQRPQHVLNLAGQLAGRHEHQPAGAAGAGVPTGQPGGQWDAERESLARAGAGPAENVGSGQGVGQDGGLDGEGRVNARRGQHGGQWRRHAERREGDAVRHVRRPGAPAVPAQGRSSFNGLSCHECRLPDSGVAAFSRAATSVETSSPTGAMYDRRA